MTVRDLPAFADLAAARWFIHKDRGDPASFLARRRRPLGGALDLVALDLACRDGSTVSYLAPWDGARAAFAWSDPALLAALLPELAPAGAAVRPLAEGTTNPSVLLDGRLAVKFFPRVEPGGNPETELLPALAGESPGLVPAVRAVAREGAHVLALAMEYVAGAVDGWERALALCRARDAAALETLARRAGLAVAALHAALRRRFGAGTPAAADPYPPQRVHGDLHLGQLLVSPGRVVFLDFEGSPLLPAATRRAPASPLVDVAGLTRSFDYAALAALGPAAEAEGLALAARARTALVAAYFEAAGDGGDPGAALAALADRELSRARYECDYERRSRPSWAWIPAAALRRRGEAPPAGPGPMPEGAGPNPPAGRRP